MIDPLSSAWRVNRSKEGLMERYALELSRKDARIRELEAQIESLRGSLVDVVQLSDRKHAAWDRAKSILSGQDAPRSKW